MPSIRKLDAPTSALPGWKRCLTILSVDAMVCDVSWDCCLGRSRPTVWKLWCQCWSSVQLYNPCMRIVGTFRTWVKIDSWLFECGSPAQPHIWKVNSRHLNLCLCMCSEVTLVAPRSCLMRSPKSLKLCGSIWMKVWAPGTRRRGIHTILAENFLKPVSHCGSLITCIPVTPLC